MENAVCLHDPRPAHEPPRFELSMKRERVDIYVVWRAAPKYLVECIEPVARSFDFHIAGISAERRMIVHRDSDGIRQARTLRCVRFYYTGTTCDQFYVGLLAVLEEIERVCPWVHLTKLDGRAEAEWNCA